MGRSSNSAVHRIQVGLIGLLAVLLFVSIANVMIDRVAPAQPNVNSATEATTNVEGAKDEVATDEPLAELGVTPTVASEEAPKNAPVPQNRPVAQPTQ